MNYPPRLRIIAGLIGHEVRMTASEGTYAIENLWEHVSPQCRVVVGEFDGKFYAIRVDEMEIDANAVVNPKHCIVTDDLDTAIMAARMMK